MKQQPCLYLAISPIPFVLSKTFLLSGYHSIIHKAPLCPEAMDFYIVKYKVRCLLHFFGPCVDGVDPFFWPFTFLPWLSSQLTGHFSFVLVSHKLADFLKLNVPGFSPRAPSSWPHPLWWWRLVLRAEMLQVCWQAPSFCFCPFGELCCLLSNCQRRVSQVLKQPPTLVFHNLIPGILDQICFSQSSPF